MTARVFRVSLLLFFFLFLFSLTSPKHIHAQLWDRTFDQRVNDSLRPDTEIFIDRQINEQLETWNYALSSRFVPLCKADGKTCLSLSKNPPAISFLGSMMAMIYDHPPASGLAWTKETLETAGILAKPAYAQGIGFAALSPFLPLWRASRNIAYTLLIVVMIVIGFMIMFQAGLDPKTVISAQSALPKVILSLILITFSYPIVGFMVDLMYLLIGLIVSVFVNAMPDHMLAGYDVARWQSDMMSGGFFTLLGTVFGAGMRALSPDDMAKFWGIGATTTVGGLATGAIVPIGGLLAGFSSALLGAVIGAIAPISIILVIVSLGLFFVFLRLLMLLANAYIQIIINLILGPFILLNEAIPGRSGFGNWILTIVANLSVFPTTALVLMFATFLTTSGIGGAWTPPFLPSGGTTLGQGFFSAFLGLSVVFLAPTLVGGVKKMFGAQSVLPVSTGTVFSPATNAIQAGTGAMSQYYYFAQLWGHEGQKGPLQQFFNAIGIGGK